MVKHYLLFLTAVLTSHLLSQAQTIIVRGKPSTGVLTWDDFTGKPDKHSRFSAQTAARIYPNIRSPKLTGDTIHFRHVEIIVELDSFRTWSRPKERTEELLIHEQNHFDIAVIFAKRYLRQIHTTVFTRSNVDSLLEQIHKINISESNITQRRYDEETRHGKDKAKQQAWNSWVALKLLEE